ncbi:cell surface A33 antigen isoform X2 [Hyperolius riggenbachi]|uniref:cell surface A33 antigen isoform X2 n=1 Tax=Hyperolius riggenbachi TaxID=752182 RepID=UPI0035A37ACB
MDTVLAAVTAINVQTPQKVVESARGKSAKLPCSYQTTAANTNGGSAIWRKLADDTEVIAAFFGNVNHSDSAYEGRVSFTGNVFTNDASILIEQLAMSDNGTYQCEITIPVDRTGTRQAKMDLIVLVAPSKPDCAIVGSAEYGQVIKLTCSSREGSPVPAYAWKSFTPQDVNRPLPQTAVIEGGELTLKNISADTSGFFICTSTNKVGSEFCNITLAVMPPSMNIALYAGVIGGSLAGIIVIGIIAYCCCCRNRDEKDDYEMADREEEEEPDQQPQKAAVKQPQQQQQQQHQYHEEEEEEDDNGEEDLEESEQRRPPMPPPNKPRLVMNA